jgi:hypothetical protein
MATTVAAARWKPAPYAKPGVKIRRRSPAGLDATPGPAQDEPVHPDTPVGTGIRGTRGGRFGRFGRRLLLVALSLTLAAVCGPARADVPVQDAGGACQPYADPARAASVRATDRALLHAYFSGVGVPAAWSLFDAYLTPGAASGQRVEVTDPDVRSAFADHPATTRAERRLLATLARSLADAPPPLTRSTPVAVPAGFGTDVGIGWTGLRTYPGILAGGRSGTRSAAGRWADRRDLTGHYRLMPTADAHGVRTGVQLVGHLRLRVLDAVDFCPGATKMAPILVDLSRLERTAYPGGGTITLTPGTATFAQPLLFGVSTDLEPVGLDVSALYAGNDRDGDGRPDRQPWRGARYPLDPCPDSVAASCVDG